ncbi:MAG: hypothetical protein LBK56_10830, partial [Gracilibacteraceae bacterium]|nr:hypothetical protein [Gracilibacteraceae bacterium]
MKKLGYTLTPARKAARYGRYRREELERMDLPQLRDICALEEIVAPDMEKIDREELIRLIWLYRGSREAFLIRSDSPEGLASLQSELLRVKKSFLPDEIRLQAKITLFTGLETNFFDDCRLPYRAELEGTNALIVDSLNSICAVLRVTAYPGREELYLTRLASLPCRETPGQTYRLYLFPQKFSDLLTAVYNQAGTEPEGGNPVSLGEEIFFYAVRLLAYSVREPAPTDLPLALDFGTSNTAAGVYLNKAHYAALEDHIRPGILTPDSVNYVSFLTPTGEAAPMLPTVIGVNRIGADGTPEYLYGYAAEELSLRGTLSDRFCVFHDLKRWVAAPEEEETLTDNDGKQILQKRRDIIAAYLGHIVAEAEQRFKCRFRKLFLSYPVKQRERFVT